MNDFSVWAAKMSLARYNFTIMHDNLKTNIAEVLKLQLCSILFFHIKCEMAIVAVFFEVFSYKWKKIRSILLNKTFFIYDQICF